MTCIFSFELFLKALHIVRPALESKAPQLFDMTLRHDWDLKKAIADAIGSHLVPCAHKTRPKDSIRKYNSRCVGSLSKTRNSLKNFLAVENLERSNNACIQRLREWHCIER